MGTDNHFQEIPEKHLIMSPCPSSDLSPPNLPGLRRLLVALRRIGIDDFPSFRVQTVSKLRVLRQYFCIKAPALKHDFFSESSYSTAVLRDRPQIVSCLLIHLIPSASFQIHQSGQQIFICIIGNDPPHNGSHFRILKGDRQLLKHISGRSVIGIKYNDDLSPCFLHRIIQPVRLSPVLAVSVERADKLIFFVVLIQHFLRPVRRIIIDRNDLQTVPVIVAFQQRVKHIVQYLLFVMHGDQYRYRLHPAGIDIAVIQSLSPHQPVLRKDKVPHRINSHDKKHEYHISLQYRYDHAHSSLPSPAS